MPSNVPSAYSPDHRSFEKRENWKNSVYGKIGKVTHRLEKAQKQLKDEEDAYREVLAQYYKVAACITKLKAFNDSDKESDVYMTLFNELQDARRKTYQAIHVRNELTEKLLKTMEANTKHMSDLLKCSRRDFSFLPTVKMLSKKHVRLSRRWEKQIDNVNIALRSAGWMSEADEGGQRLQNEYATCNLLSWRDLYRKCMMK